MSLWSCLFTLMDRWTLAAHCKDSAPVPPDTSLSTAQWPNNLMFSPRLQCVPSKAGIGLLVHTSNPPAPPGTFRLAKLVARYILKDWIGRTYFVADATASMHWPPPPPNTFTPLLLIAMPVFQMVTQQGWIKFVCHSGGGGGGGGGGG